MPRPGGRNFNDPQYAAWRAAVRKRDGYACKRCGSKKQLQVHHIKPWGEYPQLRFLVGNGITLCKTHHAQMAKNELMFEALCYALLRKKV